MISINGRATMPLKYLSAAAALALLAGCSSGSAIAPNPAGPQSDAHMLMGHVPAVVGPLAAMKIDSHPLKGASFNAWPKTGTIEYVSDFSNTVSEVSKEKTAGEAPCGELTSANGLLNPQCLFVDTKDHLWVA